MVDSKENDKFDLGVKGLSFSPSSEWRPYAQNINPTISLWWPIYIIKPFINLVLDQPIIPKLIFVFILIAPFQLFKFHLPNWLMMAYWWPVQFYCKTQNYEHQYYFWNVVVLRKTIKSGLRKINFTK